MKKINVIIMLIMVLVVVGCGSEKQRIVIDDGTSKTIASEIIVEADGNDLDKNVEIDGSESDKKDEETDETEEQEVADEAEETEISKETDEAEEQQVADELVETNGDEPHFYDSTVDEYVNKIGIDIYEAYYEGDMLIVKAYVVNGFPYPVHEINLTGFTINNEEDCIADASFGILGDLFLEADTYVTWTFSFAKEQVYIEDDDLDYLSWYASTRSSNEHFYNKNVDILLDNLNIDPYEVYYEEETLIVKAYVVNGFDHSIYNINLDELTIMNENDQIISSKNFGALSELSIAANSYVEWTFTFGSDVVYLLHDDLDNVKSYSHSTNNY